MNEANKITRSEWLVLGVLVVATVGSCFVAWWLWHQKQPDTPEVPAVVEEVLGTYLFRDDEALPSIEDEDWASWLEGVLGNPSEEELIDADLYFRKALVELTDKVYTYSVHPITETFSVVHLYGEEGELLPPPVGFWYKVDAEGDTLVEWHVGRLLPFSRYDEEYSEVWDNVY